MLLLSYSLYVWFLLGFPSQPHYSFLSRSSRSLLMTSTESVDLTRVLQVAQEAARLAGQVILQASSANGGNLQQQPASSTTVTTTATTADNIHTKTHTTDLVTATDYQCEELISQHVQHHFPSHAVIAEESSGSDKYTLTDQPTWTIDPIDGTTNFVHQLKLSCVIISFLQNQKVKVGVVYHPYSDELFFAVQGQGAFLQTGGPNAVPVPIRVSTTTELGQAVVSMEPGYGREPARVARFCALQQRVLNSGVRNLRMLGTTGLNLAHVACGRLDAAWEEGSWKSGVGAKIWDFAAGRLLIHEAGGVTRDLEYDNNLLSPNNQELHLLKRSFFAAGTAELSQSLMELIAVSDETTEETQKS